MSNEGKVSARRKELGKLTAWLLVITGFFTLLPINVGRPNFIGSFTLCSFAPVATIAMFIIALTVYWYSIKSDLVVLGILFLLIIAVFSGIWAYNTKLPMDNITVDMTIDKYYFGEHFPGEGNISKIFLNLTLHNPMMRNTPTFRIDDYDFFVEGRKLRLGTYGVFPGGGGTRRWLSPEHISLGPNETVTIDAEITLYVNDTKVERDTIGSVWPSLSRGDFTLRMDAVLVSRSYYGPEYTEYFFVMGWEPFSTSSVYHG